MSAWPSAVRSIGAEGLHVLSRPGARFRCCHRPVSPDRSPNPPCRSPGSGSSWFLPSGGVGRRPWGRDLVPRVGVAGDRHALDPEVLHPIGRDLPPPVCGGQVAAELALVPAVPGPQHVGQPPQVKVSSLLKAHLATAYLK